MHEVDDPPSMPMVLRRPIHAVVPLPAMVASFLLAAAMFDGAARCVYSADKEACLRAINSGALLGGAKVGEL